MEYLDALKSIDKLYYVSEYPIDFTDIQKNHPYMDDFGEGIYLFANKWIALIDAEYKFAKLYSSEQRIQKKFYVYSYDFNKNAIDMSKLTHHAWGYKADLMGGCWIADDFTHQEWAAFIEKRQYSQINHLMCAPIGFFHYRHYYDDTRYSLNGYLMSTRYLEFCLKSTDAIQLLSHEVCVNSFSFIQLISIAMKIWKVVEFDLYRPLIQMMQRRPI